MENLVLEKMKHTLGICRFEPGSQIPEWVGRSTFVSITQSEKELSVVCEDEYIPSSTESSRSWKAFRVKGVLDFSLTGIMSGLTTPLAAEKISIFAISTFDTDYVLVQQENLRKAMDVLENAGFTIE